MIVARSIGWEPMGTMPDDRKDGGPLLLWQAGQPRIGAWDSEPDRAGEPWGWADFYENGVRLSPEYWADINPPF
jgi:hypothetical protein